MRREPIIALFGARGQVGWEARRELGTVGEVCAYSSRDLDLRDERALRDEIRRLRPDAIYNAAAYTAVDAAEDDRDAARAINADAPRVIAEEAERIGAWAVHFSTDYVFDGTDIGRPRTEEDEPRPIGCYGETKLAGDRALIAISSRHLIFRTAWVYSDRGKNFPLTMLRMFGERDEVRVVDDQHGTPTDARFIASVSARMLGEAMRGERAHQGIYNTVCGGSTTWAGLARRLAEITGARARVVPISSSEWPTRATRPAWSTLSPARLEAALGIRIPSWEERIDLYFSKESAV